MLGARNTEAAAKGACAPTRVSPWRGVGEQMLSRRRGEGGGGSSRRPWLGGLRTPYLLVLAQRRKLEREKKPPALNTSAWVLGSIWSTLGAGSVSDLVGAATAAEALWRSLGSSLCGSSESWSFRWRVNSISKKPKDNTSDHTAPVNENASVTL